MKIIQTIDKYGKIIAVISVISIATTLLSMILGCFFNKIHIVDTEEIYTTVTVMDYKESFSQQGLYDHIKRYYVKLKIGEDIVTVEDEKLYMTSEIGDTYNIKITNHYNKYNELVEYKIKLIGKDENE